MRIEVRRVDSIKSGSEVVGNRTRAKVVKNKVARPFRQAEFDIMFGRGISRSGAVLDMAVDAGLVEKTGAWFTYAGERLAQGRENAKSFLEEHPELMAELEEKIRTLGGKLTTISKSGEEESEEARTAA